ncbi:uncharacterized protein LOC135554550 [Oncorhynchus masou masou]|uniref:uncharacterized protein LOC135554550 n=1 Tax=Oncorhynchus masou masou TaxID=90313 RepID=UPI00318421F6
MYPENPQRIDLDQTELINFIFSQIALACVLPGSSKLVALTKLQDLSMRFYREGSRSASAFFLLSILFWPEDPNDNRWKEASSAKNEKVLISAIDDLQRLCMLKTKPRKGRIVTHYREEVRALGVWCQENNLTLNVNKTKEMIVDFRKQQREHPPIHIDGTVVERVASFKFLGIHITDNLNWSTHTDSIVKKAQQRLFNLRRLKKFGLSPKALTNFYRGTIESILAGCITAWYGNCSALNRKALQRVVRSAQGIIGGKLPALQDTYTTRCYRKAIKIIKDIYHPSHCLFTPLSSRRRGQYRCIKAGTERLKNSFYLKAIRLLNSHH